MVYNVLRLAAGGGNRIPSAGTVAKFINKSSLFILSLNRDFSARNYCSIMNKKLIVIPSAPLAATDVSGSFSTDEMSSFYYQFY